MSRSFCYGLSVAGGADGAGQWMWWEGRREGGGFSQIVSLGIISCRTFLTVQAYFSTKQDRRSDVEAMARLGCRHSPCFSESAIDILS